MQQLISRIILKGICMNNDQSKHENSFKIEFFRFIIVISVSLSSNEVYRYLTCIHPSLFALNLHIVWQFPFLRLIQRLFWSFHISFCNFLFLPGMERVKTNPCMFIHRDEKISFICSISTYFIVITQTLILVESQVSKSTKPQKIIEQESLLRDHCMELII